MRRGAGGAELARELASIGDSMLGGGDTGGFDGGAAERAGAQFRDGQYVFEWAHGAALQRGVVVPEAPLSEQGQAVGAHPVVLDREARWNVEEGPCGADRAAMREGGLELRCPTRSIRGFNGEREQCAEVRARGGVSESLDAG